MDTARRKYIGVGSYWVPLPLYLPLFVFFRDLNYSDFSSARQIFSLKASWMNSRSFPAGLEEDVVKFCDYHAREQRHEQFPWSDRSHIYHWREYFPIYCEEGYNGGKGVVLDTLELIRCLLPQGRPCWFRIYPIPKCAVWTWRLTKLTLCCRSELLCQYNSRNFSAQWGPFPRNTFCPCATDLLEAWQFSRAFYLRGCYKNTNATWYKIGG